MKPTILLMLSGGVDSTYLLYHYLSNTDYPIHAHHISIQYPDTSRWKMEGQAVTKITDYLCKHYRDFDYSESQFSMTFGKNKGMDSDLQLLVASKVVANLTGDTIKVALGWCSEDMQHVNVAERAERRVTPKLWKALCASVNDKRVSDQLDMPLLELTKVQMLQKMPPALLRLCWSCRTGAIDYERDGEVVVPCGYCHACQLNKTALEAAKMPLHSYPNLAVEDSVVYIPQQKQPSSGLQYRVVANMPGTLPKGGIASAPVYAIYPAPNEFQLKPQSGLVPCRTDIDLQGQLCFVLDNVLSANEADELVRISETLGYNAITPGIHNPPGVRMNKAVHWISDNTFLGAVMKRIRHLLPTKIDGGSLCNQLSQRVNMYKYDCDDVFNKHLDAAWPSYSLSESGRSINELPGTITKMTMLIYLNGPEDGIKGGNTKLFCRDGSVIEVVPKKGRALCFRHGRGEESVLHEGAKVLGSLPKYVAKINVAYYEKTYSKEVR